MTAVPLRSDYSHYVFSLIRALAIRRVLNPLGRPQRVLGKELIEAIVYLGRVIGLVGTETSQYRKLVAIHFFKYLPSNSLFGNFNV